MPGWGNKLRYTALRDFYNIFFFGGILLVKIGDRDRVLEVGCGRNSLMVKSHLVEKADVTGVDVFQPYIDSHKKDGLYKDCICGDITKMDFRDKTFDTVVCMDVIEHLAKEDGVRLLIKMRRWGDRVIITTPNGFTTSDVPFDNNPQMIHVSGWSVEELQRYGYKVRGLSGWKQLRTDNAQLRYTFPYLFWAGISLLSEIFVYYRPEAAWHLLATYEKGG